MAGSTAPVRHQQAAALSVEDSSYHRVSLNFETVWSMFEQSLKIILWTGFELSYLLNFLPLSQS